jgi:hypothetical protein
MRCISGEYERSELARRITFSKTNPSLAAVYNMSATNNRVYVAGMLE